MILDYTKIICNLCNGKLVKSDYVKNLFICENKLYDKSNNCVLHSSLYKSEIYHNFEKDKLPYEIKYIYDDNYFIISDLNNFLITNKNSDITDFVINVNKLQNPYDIEEYKKILKNLIFR